MESRCGIEQGKVMERQFSSWYPLTDEGIAREAPEGPAAVQVRREDGLVDYSSGKSAMVCYFFARENAREALAERFDDEVARPGSRGQGPLVFRVLTGEEAKDTLADLLFKFVQNFGEAPLYNRYG